MLERVLVQKRRQHSIPLHCLVFTCAPLQVDILQPDCVQRWGVKLDWTEKATSATGGSYFVIEPLQIEMCGHPGFAVASLGLLPGVSILFSTRDDAPLQQEAKAGGV